MKTMGAWFESLLLGSFEGDRWVKDISRFSSSWSDSWEGIVLLLKRVGEPVLQYQVWVSLGSSLNYPLLQMKYEQVQSRK